MKKINYLKPWSLNHKNVVIGNFDLIHKKHWQLLDLNNNYVVLTFTNIPRKQNYTFNNSIAKNYFLKKQTGHKIYFFNLAKNNMSAKEFVNKYLLKTNLIMVGSDFCFGNDHKNIQEFKNCLNIKLLKYDKNISTTIIKNLLSSGKIVQANNLLHQPFSVYQKVEHGLKLGRQLGFRTANFNYCDNLKLKHGVYLTKTIINNKIYKSITMYGKPKTIKNINYNIMETHIIDFDKIIYNKYIEVQFFAFIAPIKKFASKQALIEALEQFKQKALITNY